MLGRTGVTTGDASPHPLSLSHLHIKLAQLRIKKRRAVKSSGEETRELADKGG